MTLANMRQCGVRSLAITCGQRRPSMIDLTMKSEEEILHFGVSDKALEIAAGPAKEMANFTLGSCTNITVCPH
jgi:hypothetical protein